MHWNKFKIAAAALVAAIALGMPALAKSTHRGKEKAVATLAPCGAKAPRQRALNAHGSLQRSPTFGAPNPNSPALIGGGSTVYNANLYVY